ncbi:MAG: TIGR04255 family protein [Cyclobacteriaceae bacterium]|jgi:uncharacterized protein (TIGR04255 family)|nr:TIGR04255 family protein [Cyclobacteriaceae bacterium]
MPKLPNAPLQEAIFEIRWELDIESATNQQVDGGYALAQGKLQEIVRPGFPLHKRKIPLGVPDQLFLYQIINQYWSGEDTWPVLQLGPGIFTVNDTDKNYDWDQNYFPLINRALDWIHKAYEDRLKINMACLRYIDSVALSKYGYDGRWQEFIHEHFNFRFENKFNSRGRINRIQFEQYFELEDKSALHIAMSSGKYRKTDQDALVWQTAVVKSSRFSKDSLLDWVKNAHSITSDLFREMTRRKFYDSFK